MKKLFLLIAVIACAGYSFGQTNITQLGNLSYSKVLSDIWGYEDGGKEYALVGVNDGLSIVDVTNPATPTQLFFISGPTSTWRDIKTYNKHAYVVNEQDSIILVV
ncbi:MAG: hypothetical protein IIA45_11165, partial [Bacteroidetes bacterium]|nr:hypothetical protein [Bacteroidota bacterium]